MEMDIIRFFTKIYFQIVRNAIASSLMQVWKYSVYVFTTIEILSVRSGPVRTGFRMVLVKCTTSKWCCNYKTISWSPSLVPRPRREGPGDEATGGLARTQLSYCNDQIFFLYIALKNPRMKECLTHQLPLFIQGRNFPPIDRIRHTKEGGILPIRYEMVSV